MTMSNQHRIVNLNNAKIRSHENGNERNGINSDNAEFESWACESFNLIDYLGEDTSPLDEVVPEKMDEDGIKEDALYSQFQYTDMLLGDQQPIQRNEFDISDYASVPSSGNSDFNVPSFHDASNISGSIPSGTQLVYPNQNLDSIPHVPSTSKASLPVVKEEPVAEQETQPPEFKDVLQPSSSRESSMASDGIQTTLMLPGSSGTSMRPRKYRVKPDAEKQNPMYRMKRQKNNDAVRRSRDKAKRIQEAKENELKFLHEDNYRKNEIIESLKNNYAKLQREHLMLKQNCKCGATSRLGKR